jgi:hypothetical protein
VWALNKVAAAVFLAAAIPFLDLYSPLYEGAGVCGLYAPKCKGLAVHYARAG